MKVCSIGGCESTVLARGWCSAHYQRWKKWGDANAPHRPGGKGRMTDSELVHGTLTAANNYGCRCDLCRDARNAYGREWAANNAEKRRAMRLKTRYGLPAGEYDRMFAEQGGVCAICKSPPSEEGRTKRLHVDHCHRTGDVRALLCFKCNGAIGKFNDDPDLVMAAAAYLLQFTDVLTEKR